METESSLAEERCNREDQDSASRSALPGLWISRERPAREPSHPDAAPRVDAERAAGASWRPESWLEHGMPRSTGRVLRCYRPKGINSFLTDVMMHVLPGLIDVCILSSLEGVPLTNFRSVAGQASKIVPIGDQ